NTHTYYSYKFGAWAPKALLNRAVEFGYGTVCITDINNTSAVLECMRLSRTEINIRVIPGIDFRNGAEQLFVGIPKTNAGFQQINQYLSSFLHSREPIPSIAPAWDDVFVIYPFNKSTANSQQLLASGYIGIRPHDIPQLRLSPLRHHPERLVMLPTVTFSDKHSFNAHRLLRAMDNNLLLSKLPKSEEGDPRHQLLPKKELLAFYQDFPEIVKNAEALVEQCDVSFEFKTNKNKRFYTTSHEEDMRLLRSECEKGLDYRYPMAGDNIRKRLDHELKVISEKDFASYFLINWNLINYARHKGYFYVGRGSGANSLAAYLLRITDVDPIELDLYFERFINPHRASPPDFDIDFSWLDREDITRYIFDTYGHDRVALQATYSTFQFKAVTRELGKVLGVPAHEIDQLQRRGKAHGIGQYGDLILKYSQLIDGFPSHLSIHSSGILISEEPINAYSPTFLPPKGYPTTQFDMISAEDLGLYKFDILSQRGLGKIRDSIEIIKTNTGDEIDIHDIKRFKQDEEIKTLLREARAIGCFYVESPAMRMLLTKLRAEDYLGLVAASSVIRPGVAKSGMMREFIIRFRDKDKREEAREKIPEFYDLLKETYGVMVYQEDVIKVAHFFAGLSLAEADVLRRGMSWKFKERSEFHKVEEKFKANCLAKGHSRELVEKIWNEVNSFANFAFAKGHSASYAVESYQALFLKAYYPIEYMVATINNGGGFYRPELYIHEARMHGAVVQPPCVNRGERNSILFDKTIILGLNMVGELESKAIDLILSVRKMGEFDSLADFVDRVPISVEQLRAVDSRGNIPLYRAQQKRN
ncbi:MAG: DNA polymerase III subunit alpha, partial [Flavobacteriales bacterium]